MAETKNQPLLSLIVPTKNRYKYLKYLIEYIHGINSPELEMIIQDNSDDNTEIVEFLRNIDNDLIRYFYTQKSLTIIENSDLAVKNSIGEYVCYIGDDDGVLRNITEFVKWMKDNDIDSMVCPRLNYVWTDIEGNLEIIKTSKVVLNSTKEIINIDPVSELYKCISRGAQSLKNMPRLYHGIVSRNCLNKLYDRVGTYFPGPSPDMANSVALCLIVKKHVYVDYPYIIAGTGFVRVKGQLKGDVSELNTLPFLPRDTEEKWESNIPKIWTTPTIYAESAIKALRNLDEEKYLTFFNYNFFYAIFIYNHRSLLKRFKTCIKSNGNIIIICIYYFLFLIYDIKQKKQKNIRALFSKKSRLNIRANTVVDYINNVEKIIG